MGCTLTQARQSALCGLQVGLKAGSSGLAKEEVGCTYPEPILGGLRAALYVKRAAFVSGPALHMYLSSADLISILTPQDCSRLLPWTDRQWAPLHVATTARASFQHSSIGRGHSLYTASGSYVHLLPDAVARLTGRTQLHAAWQCCAGWCQQRRCHAVQARLHHAVACLTGG